MDLLLDTHALLWWLDGDLKLAVAARQAIADPANTVLVSAASAWEIANKVQIGKLPNAVYFAEHCAFRTGPTPPPRCRPAPRRAGCWSA